MGEEWPSDDQDVQVPGTVIIRDSREEPQRWCHESRFERCRDVMDGHFMRLLEALLCQCRVIDQKCGGLDVFRRQVAQDVDTSDICQLNTFKHKANLKRGHDYCSDQLIYMI